MILRILEEKLARSAKKYPVIVITGPRQSGKTTLVKKTFPDKAYVSLEDLDVRDFAAADPRGFLNSFPKGVILDEIQRVPELLSYIQTRVDENKKNGFFILTGSQNFLLMDKLSQTLAGRVHILQLLPFSLEELSQAGKLPRTVEKMIFQGMYPRIYQKASSPLEWYGDYLQTYVERDVRLIKNIENLALFQKFLKLCAARTGQLLNFSSIGEECGIKHNTVKAWLGILEASFIIHLLRPYHESFNKRLVKMPKLYFVDTGLACSLLEIENEKQLKSHPLRGNLFETAIVAELIKSRTNQGRRPNAYFWRDKTGHEIDFVMEQSGMTMLAEIKSSETISSDLFKNLLFWRKIAKRSNFQSFLIYGGAQPQKRKEAVVIGWQETGKVFNAESGQ